MPVELWIIGAVAVYLAFQFGVVIGRQRQREQEELYRRANEETDPDKKRQLLLRWNELSEGWGLKRRFRKALTSMSHRHKNDA